MRTGGEAPQLAWLHHRTTGESQSFVGNQTPNYINFNTEEDPSNIILGTGTTFTLAPGIYIIQAWWQLYAANWGGVWNFRTDFYHSTNGGADWYLSTIAEGQRANSGVYERATTGRPIYISSENNQITGYVTFQHHRNNTATWNPVITYATHWDYFSLEILKLE